MDRVEPNGKPDRGKLSNDSNSIAKWFRRSFISQGVSLIFKWGKKEAWSSNEQFIPVKPVKVSYILEMF